MKLSQLYQNLSYGLLSNLAMSDDGQGMILFSDQPKILIAANEALLKLYTKFIVKERELIIEFHQDISSYKLLPRYALHYNPTGLTDDEPVRYIMDSADDPFVGDVLKILSVTGDASQQFPLNDDDHYLSLFTPQPTTLQVPIDLDETWLGIKYQASHPKLINDLDSIIELPDVLHGALFTYIAYRIYSNMNTEGSSAKAAEHLARYELELIDVRNTDMINTSVSYSNIKFHNNGWT